MRCFNHNEREAVGICKNCNKGLCVDCVVEVENGIACKGECENAVKIINNLILQSGKSYETTATVYHRNGIIWIVLGLAFFIHGFVNNYLLGIVIGIGFILLGIFSLNYSRKFKKLGKGGVIV